MYIDKDNHTEFSLNEKQWIVFVNFKYENIDSHKYINPKQEQIYSQHFLIWTKNNFVYAILSTRNYLA